MSFLLDTNVISELRQPRGFNPQVIEWVKSQAASEAYLSTITLLEIRRGILLIQQRDPSYAEKLSDWLNNIVWQGFSDRILPVSAEVALACAQLHVPKMRPYADSLIAATAIVHELIVVTRDTRGFVNTGAKFINPWEA